MANVCDECGVECYRLRYSAARKKLLGIGSGSCGCYGRALNPQSTVSPFAIEFQHVNDEFGRPLKVENLRQLSAAEKRLGFQSVVLNSDAQNFDDPPQQKKVTMQDVHRYKFARQR